MAAMSLSAKFLESFAIVHGNGELSEEDWVLFSSFLPMEGPLLIKIKCLKDMGNDFFRQNLFESAGGCYDMACRLLCYTLKTMDDFDIESVVELAISLNLNLAACANKLEEYEAAKKCCSLVLSSIPKNAKALFRSALAFMKTNMLLEAQSDLEIASMLEPKNKDILREMKVVKNLRSINPNGKRSIDDHLLLEVARDCKRPIPVLENIGDNFVEDDGGSSGCTSVSSFPNSITKDTCNFYDGLAKNPKDKFSPNMDLDQNCKEYQESDSIKMFQFSKTGGGNSVLRIDARTYKKLLQGKEVSFFKKSHLSTMKIRILQPSCVEPDSTCNNPRRKKRKKKRRRKRNCRSSGESHSVVKKSDYISSSFDTNMHVVCEPNSEPTAANSTKQSLLTGEIIGTIPESHNKNPQTHDKPRTNFEIPLNRTDSQGQTTQTPNIPRAKKEFLLKCFDSGIPQTCPTDYPEKTEVDPEAPPSPTCPDYFRWIYEDLKPWRETGITRDMVEKAKKTANFRLVILNGKAYVETYHKGYQTRDLFTLWGFLQLLRRYPGRVPDLELMFDCVDWPVIRKHSLPDAAVPPLFRYCGDDKTLDIVFPDWTFWGWAEVNIKAWDLISNDIKEGNKIMKYMDRAPYAYWKGNPYVAQSRLDLLKCNVSDKQEWGARIFIQDWNKELQEGYKQSNLAHQCKDKYKIYIEGSAWSVSEKYILACDSVTLIMKPKYYDFFSRGLMPTQHYWPIRESDKCRSIKFAVDWGNSHKQKAQAMGKAASEFILEDVKMDYVYDYMLHMLTEYAKLLKFKPTLPQNAVELCSETLVCNAEDYQKRILMGSLVTSPSDKSPCAMPPPYDPVSLLSQLRRKNNAEKQVEKWEKNYWDNLINQH
ncbi:hypothetical protein KSS87_018987 [Heliosperma pusillum]|nr:hypothetical protein KSS87_018987 [Heliosperma pusillum]